MNLKKIFIISVAVAIFNGLFLPSKIAARVNVIFDIGGVFVDRDRWSISRYAGFPGLINLMLRGKNPKTLLFDMLNEIDFPGELTADDLKTCDPEGNSFPACLLHWLKGYVSGQDIIKAVENYYESADCGKTESYAINRMIRAIYDPDLFEQTTHVYQRALDFLQECIDAGYHVYILSNLDNDSFKALDNMLPGFFNLFDGVVISAHVKLMKPNPAIFSYTLDTYNLKPEETVFIDDQQENLNAAQKMGIFPIECRKSGFIIGSPNFKSVKASFHKWIADKEKTD